MVFWCPESHVLKPDILLNRWETFQQLEKRHSCWAKLDTGRVRERGSLYDTWGVNPMITQCSATYCVTDCELDDRGPWPIVWASASTNKRTLTMSKSEFKTFKINFSYFGCFFKLLLLWLSPTMGNKLSLSGRRNENLISYTWDNSLLSWLFCSDLGDNEPGQNSLKLVEQPAIRTQKCPPFTHRGFLKDYDGASFLQRNGWSSATLRVLSSMPSRTAGKLKWLVIDMNVNNLIQHGI